MENLKRALYALLWPAACAAIAFFAIFIDINNNLFDWEPRFHWQDILCLLGSIITLVVLFFYTKKLTTTIPLYLAMFASIALLMFAFYLFVSEGSVSSGSFINILNRSTESPWWYKAMRSFILATPIFLWFRALHHYQIVSEQ
ncbi:hypothetical protein [Candidatus Uabimicrobium amorphum]|uniref:Uncharacterized protein n=1 Tax=Uabimicrobium amorphum TaxID=2596890 RepID=A0A5S9ITP3_UABAM|nr:hypothetical protein [Candidatus Uabimicrobium amorphum]BBM87232.1 hypothetical protein UABAM_05635 [Candidatus Uabimicrobium amorphum]